MLRVAGICALLLYSAAARAEADCDRGCDAKRKDARGCCGPPPAPTARNGPSLEVTLRELARAAAAHGGLRVTHDKCDVTLAGDASRWSFALGDVDSTHLAAEGRHVTLEAKPERALVQVTGEGQAQVHSVTLVLDDEAVAAAWAKLWAHAIELCPRPLLKKSGSPVGR